MYWTAYWLGIYSDVIDRIAAVVSDVGSVHIALIYSVASSQLSLSLRLLVFIFYNITFSLFPYTFASGCLSLCLLVGLCMIALSLVIKTQSLLLSVAAFCLQLSRLAARIAFRFKLVCFCVQIPQCICYLRRHLASERIVTLGGVTLSHCVCVYVSRIRLGGEGNALYPLLSS